MSIYIGDKEYDLHYSTTGDKVNRSTFLGKEKVWPLYEFSFYDGSMQKTEEGIAASGKTNSQQIRTCEDSWWHKLQFDEVYVFDQKTDITWLRYNATKLQCQNNKYHWLSVKSAGSSVSPTNSDNYQTISFSDNYSSFNGGTCSESSNDTTMSYEIDKNEWFKPRSGRMYGMQYDEWYHLSGKTIEGFSHKISPSDNNPTIFVTQVANSWGNNNQQIEFTCSSETTDNNVTLTWKIYSNSTSGTTIYYGSNIASNNKTVDGDETYEEGKMWITTSNTNITLNNDVKKEIKSNGVVIWTMTATWSDNSANSSNCYHDIKFSGIPSSIGLEGATFNVSATCTQTSQSRANTFTLNVGSKNNWRPDSATCECKQDGETVTVDCCMSTTGTFGENCEKSVKITVDAVTETEKEYILYSDKSSVGGENSTFTITSYYTQSGSSGGGGTVWAKCPDGGPIVSASYSQQSFSGDSGFVDVTVSCTGSETITPGSTIGNTKSFTVSEHPFAGDKNAIITVTQNESGKQIKISHIAPPKIEYGYQYQVIICEKATDTSHTSSVTVGSSTTSKTMYARLLEKCTAICEGEIVNDESYDYKFLSKEPTTKSGVTLNDLSFSFSGDKWSKNSTTVETDAVKIIIGGSINNDTNSGTTSITMNLVKDTISSITNVCDANSTAFTFDFSLSQVQMIGGYSRTGIFTASYSGQSANTNFSQTSSVSSSEGKSSPVSGLKISDFESSLSDSKNFEISSISETNISGKYTVTVKTKTAYNATDGSIGSGSSYSFTISEGSATTYISNTDPVSLGVKLWQGSENTTINGESSRTVYATIKYSDKSITTSTKTQYVCKTPGNDIEVKDVGITWSASETNNDLYTKYDPKTGNSTKVYIKRANNINSESKTITFTATLNSDTSIKQSFDLIWPKNNEGGSTIDEWEYQVDTNISLSTNCPATNIRVEVRNGTSVDFSIDLEEVQPGTTINNKSNKNKTSESSVTRDIYIIYGTTENLLTSYTFTKTDWRYTAQDTKTCSISETYTINLSSTDDQYICPGSVYSFSYRIQTSSGSNVNGSEIGATIESSNNDFSIGTPNYSDGVNTVNITGSYSEGANTTITIKVDSVSESFELNTYDIYNVSIDNDKSSVSVEVDSGSKSDIVELKYNKNGIPINYSDLPTDATVVTSCSNIDITHSINTDGNLSYSFNAPSNSGNDIITISLSSSSGWVNCSSGTQFTIFYTEKDVPVGLFEDTSLSYSFCLGEKIKIATISWSDGVCHSDYIEITNKEGDTFTITNECESNKDVIYATNNECKPENGGKKGTVTITVSGESKDIELISYDYWEISYNTNTSTGTSGSLCAAGTNDYVSAIFSVKVNDNYFTDNEIKNYGLGAVSITAPDIAGTTKSIKHTTNGQWEVRYTIKDSDASYDDKITASIENLPYCSCGIISAESATNVTINQYTCGYIEDAE